MNCKGASLTGNQMAIKTNDTDTFPHDPTQDFLSLDHQTTSIAKLTQYSV